MLTHRPDQASSAGAQPGASSSAGPAKGPLTGGPTPKTTDASSSGAPDAATGTKPVPRLELRPSDANAAIARAERKLSQPGYHYVDPFAQPLLTGLRQGAASPDDADRLDRMFEVSKTGGGSDLAPVKAASDAYHAALGRRAIDELTAGAPATGASQDAVLGQLHTLANTLVARYNQQLEDDVRMRVDLGAHGTAGNVPARVTIAPNDWWEAIFACLGQLHHLITGTFRRTPAPPPTDLETGRHNGASDESTPLLADQQPPSSQPPSSQPPSSSSSSQPPPQPAITADPNAAYASELRAAQQALHAGQLDHAHELFAALLTKLPAPPPTDAVTATAPERILRAALTRKHERFLNALLENLVAPPDQVRAAVQSIAGGGRAAKEGSAASSTVGVAVDEAMAAFAQAKQQLTGDYFPRYVAALRDEAQTSPGKAQPAGSAKVEDPGFRDKYAELALAKYEVNHKADAPTGDATEIKLKRAVLEHLEVSKPEKELGKSLDELLRTHIKNKSTSIEQMFRADPKLREDCLARITDVQLHQLLTDMRASGEAHSIHDVNDYVGDKISDPLMQWVVSQKIPVEVHATSSLASAAKLSSEGFTDLFDLPSAHTATKKLIAFNPKTGFTKVVIQSLPGTSYAVQTSGQFLFYELYNYSKTLADSIPVPKGLYEPDGYRVQKLVGKANGKARYLLAPVAPASSSAASSASNGSANSAKAATTAHVAEVPCPDGATWEIIDGKLKVPEGMAGTIRITEDTVARMDPAQLTVHEEKVDYVPMYLDALKTHGVTQADIAVIGESANLAKELGGNKKDHGAKPTGSINLPHFNASIFHVVGKDAQTKVMLTFTISPHFFGDRAGFLVQALKQLGVQHVLFTGTAGGLEVDAKVGDIVFPDRFADASDGKNKPVGGVHNAARPYGEQLSQTERPVDKTDTSADAPKQRPDNVKLGGAHVGVHAPITESREMIERLKRERVSSVDCEAGFIADAIKGSGMSLYHFVRLSDVPNSEHSIGMGGMASDTGAQGNAPEVKQLDVVMAILKDLLGNNIRQADHQARSVQYPIVKGEIAGLWASDAARLAAMKASESQADRIATGGSASGSNAASSSSATDAASSKKAGKAKAGKGKAADLNAGMLAASVDVMLAPIGEGHAKEAEAILALFAQQVSEVFTKHHGVVPTAMTDVNKLVQSFYSTHKIKIEVRYRMAT